MANNLGFSQIEDKKHRIWSVFRWVTALAFLLYKVKQRQTGSRYDGFFLLMLSSDEFDQCSDEKPLRFLQIEVKQRWSWSVFKWVTT